MKHLISLILLSVISVISCVRPIAEPYIDGKGYGPYGYNQPAVVYNEAIVQPTVAAKGVPIVYKEQPVVAKGPIIFKNPIPPPVVVNQAYNGPKDVYPEPYAVPYGYKEPVAEQVVYKSAVNGPLAVKQLYAEPVVAKQVYAEPVVTRQVYAEPVVTKQVYAEPVVARQVYAEPVVTKQVYAEPVAVAEPIVYKNAISGPLAVKQLYAGSYAGPKQVYAEPELNRQIIAEPIAEPIVTNKVPIVNAYNEPLVYKDAYISVYRQPVYHKSFHGSGNRYVDADGSIIWDKYGICGPKLINCGHLKFSLKSYFPHAYAGYGLNYDNKLVVAEPVVETVAAVTKDYTAAITLGDDHWNHLGWGGVGYGLGGIGVGHDSYDLYLKKKKKKK